MADRSTLVQDLRRLPGRLSLARTANHTSEVRVAPVTHDIAIATRLPDGTWSIDCECGDTITAATEAAAWNAFEHHAGGVRP